MRRDGLRSIRSCSRARTDGQRGYALIWAIGLAVLFFMLVQLVLIDSSRELAEARRFRAQIVASALAENAAELTAARIVDRDYAPAEATDFQGRMTGEMRKNPADGSFRIIGDGTTTGTNEVKARVEVHGYIENNVIHVNFTMHTP